MGIGETIRKMPFVQKLRLKRYIRPINIWDGGESQTQMSNPKSQIHQIAQNKVQVHRFIEYFYHYKKSQDIFTYSYTTR
jgi:hypothetical protein